MTRRVLDLFSGIGGFTLGLERAGGFETVAFCESNEFCRQALARHWPEVPIFEDVRRLSANRLDRHGIRPDVIAGGFPCVDLSRAGTRSGLRGEASGLWREFARIISEVRPRLVLVENVSDNLDGSLGPWFGDVLGDLASLGYGAEWHCIQAADAGAPHIRDRVWIVAHAEEQRFQEGGKSVARSTEWPDGASDCQPEQGSIARRAGQSGMGLLAHGISDRLAGDWPTDDGIARTALGVTDCHRKLAALGNSLVPAIPEIIGRTINAVWGDL